MPTAIESIAESEGPLNPGQQAVVDRGLLNSGFNAVLQMPTSAGKTWLAEQAIARVLAGVTGARDLPDTPWRARQRTARPGYECKHVLAVRLHCQDDGLHALVKRSSSWAGTTELDLFLLWFDEGKR
jgi:hypothetical protein